MTPACLDDHVVEFFQDDVGVVVVVQDRDGGQLCGGAAGQWGVRVHEVDKGLDDGVVGGVHVSVQGEIALALAVIGSVGSRGDNPVLDEK